MSTLSESRVWLVDQFILCETSAYTVHSIVFLPGKTLLPLGLFQKFTLIPQVLIVLYSLVLAIAFSEPPGRSIVPPLTLFEGLDSGLNTNLIAFWRNRTAFFE